MPHENDLRIPDIEIIVGCAGDDVAVFGFYLREDVHQGYDVVCALSGKDARAIVRQVLQDAIQALNTADWVTVDELDQDEAAQTEDPPF